MHEKANGLGQIPHEKRALFEERFNGIAGRDRDEALGLIGRFEADQDST